MSVAVSPRRTDRHPVGLMTVVGLHVGVTGVSKIRFTGDALGRIAAAQILQSSGATREHRLMDKAAADALAQRPVTVGTDETGLPVGGTADVDGVWALN